MPGHTDCDRSMDESPGTQPDKVPSAMYLCTPDSSAQFIEEILTRSCYVKLRNGGLPTVGQHVDVPQLIRPHHLVKNVSPEATSLSPSRSTKELKESMLQ